MEGVDSSHHSHRKLSNNKSDKLVVMNDKHERHESIRRKKAAVARVQSLPIDGEPISKHQLQTGSGNLRRSHSSRRNHRGSSTRPSTRRASVAHHPNNGHFSSPGMAKAELLLQNVNLQLQHQNELGADLATHYSAGSSNTSMKLNSQSNANRDVNRHSFRGKSVTKQTPGGSTRGENRRYSQWSGEQMRGDFSEILTKCVNHPQSIVSFSVILVVIGVLLIVVAISSNSQLLNYIGIGFIILGVLVFTIGAAWFYKHSREIAHEKAIQNGRANLRLINLQVLEEEKDDGRVESETPAGV